MSTSLFTPLTNLKAALRPPVVQPTRVGAFAPGAALLDLRLPTTGLGHVSEFLGKAFATWASGGHIR